MISNFRHLKGAIFKVLAAATLAVFFLIWSQAHFQTAERLDADTQHCLTDGVSLDNIAFIIKTGASEAFEKLPTQIETTFRCVKNVLVVADLEFDLPGHHSYDVLRDVDPLVRDHDPAFDIYHEQRRMRKEGYSIEQIGNTSLSHDAAWELDKFKFLPMVYKASTDMPNKDWYVFLEADTYVNLMNLYLWLSQLDADEKLYIGSPTYAAGTRFIHGGSGYILSGTAIRAFAEVYPAMAATWDEKTTKECCGDYILTLALKEVGVSASGAWPMFSGESPLEIPYGPAVWCQPILTLHHVVSTNLREMWSLEHEIGKNQVRG